MRFAIVGLAITLGACSRSSAPAAAPASPPDAPPPPRAAYHVAGKKGVVEINADGSVGKTLAATENASSPRYLPGRKGIAYLAEADVHVLSLETGKDEKIASLPTTAKCHAGDDYDITLSVQSREDVRLDADGSHLCVLLQDRNVNMMSYARSVRVDLKTHKVEDRWTTWEQGCDEKDTGEALDCPEKPAPARKEPGSFPYRYVEHRLVGPGDKVITGMGDFVADESAPSPTGRWVLLAGNLDAGDYIHGQFLLLDRQTGEVIPLGGSTAWPKPLTKKELKHPTRETLGDRAGDFVGESARWFLDENTLAMEGAILFLDRKQIIGLPGELAE